MDKLSTALTEALDVRDRILKAANQTIVITGFSNNSYDASFSASVNKILHYRQGLCRQILERKVSVEDQELAIKNFEYYNDQLRKVLGL
jgi:hypothetical protein